jgi:hypothetical protein
MTSLFRRQRSSCKRKGDDQEDQHTDSTGGQRGRHIREESNPEEVP